MTLFFRENLSSFRKRIIYNLAICLKENRYDNAIGLLNKFRATFPTNKKYDSDLYRVNQVYGLYQNIIFIYQLFKANKANEVLAKIPELVQKLNLLIATDDGNSNIISQIDISEARHLSFKCVELMDQLKMNEAVEFVTAFTRSKRTTKLDISKSQINIKQSANTEVLVSAIVSTYNSEKFIAGCLEDLVNQSIYKSGLLEIVIVNSGSAKYVGIPCAV